MAGKSKKKSKLAALRMDRKLPRARYETKLAELQSTLTRIQQAFIGSDSAAVIVFEGWDAAGKGGTIRRIATVMDPRGLKVWPISAPNDFFRGRHYLARFMARLPASGQIAVFDRSWYGRVLVERVEALVPETRWRPAYREIVDFERMLIEDGTRVVKLFLHITPEEQLSRFQERLDNPFKRWKLSHEDFRNRARWDDYAEATEEMLERTSTKAAPWHVIPANDKKHARIQAISTIVKALSKGMDLGPQPMDPRVVQAAREELTIPPELEGQLDQASG